MSATQNGSANQLRIFFHAVDGIGHLNACVGIGQSLAARGHKITFLINDAFKGSYTKYGFEEILLTQKPTAPSNGQSGDAVEEKKNPVKDMADLLKNNGFLGPKSPLEKLRDQLNSSNNFMDKFYNQIVEYTPQIGEALKREKPDAIILDTFLIPPSVRQSGIPWMLLFSPNPIFLYRSKALPPFGGGFATTSDPSTWVEYEKLWKEQWKKNFLRFQENLDKEFNFEPNDKVDDDFFVTMSPFLNIYGYPEELDYTDIAPRPDNLVAVDAFCRETPEPFEIPQELAGKSGKLIYVSLGSMGSIDVELMKRITAILAKTPHKYIVSKGQRGEEFQLPPNCWGANFLPQTKILPLVDLVITHGGNNTITEAFSFGKPMIVLPLFGDQFDNAQRVQEKGYGIRLEPYSVTENELVGAIDKLLNDAELHKKAKVAAERMAKSKSKENVAKRIEEVVAKSKTK